MGELVPDKGIKNQRRINWATNDALLLAGTTALLYVCTFVREYGYFSYFRIPIEFIGITPGKITASIATTAIAGGIWAYHLFSGATKTTVKHRSTLLSIVFLLDVFPLFAFLFVLIGFPFNSIVVVVAFAMWPISTLCIYTCLYFRFKNPKARNLIVHRWTDKRNAAIDRFRSIREEPLKTNARNLATTALVMITFFWIDGCQEARFKQTFYMNDANQLLLSSSNDILILAPWNADTKMIEPRILLSKIPEGETAGFESITFPTPPKREK